MNGNSIAPPAPLEVRGVTKLFGDFRAVDDVSFSLPAGSIYGFLGPNGAGKTTTIRMILEIIKPTTGSISVLGHASALAVRHRIGYLPEEKGLYKKMKCWAVIAYFATLKGLSRKVAKQRAFELLERHGLKDFATKPTEALSKGMGQKVQVLASIAHDPEFVILDEPFSGLDPVNQQVMEDIIHDMAKRGRTVLFSTHVMQHAERLCDRILLLAKGRKIFDGTVVEAKRTIPRRVRIETEDDIAPLRELSDVVEVRQLETINGAVVPVAPAFSLASPKGGEGRGEEAQYSAGQIPSPQPSPRLGGEREIGAPPGCAPWGLELRDHADPQAILQTCFARGIRLRSFNQSDPTLHEVFMRLVGPDAKEAAFR